LSISFKVSINFPTLPYQGSKIGTCSTYFGGVNFSSVHKPNKEVGTGFRLSGEFAEPELLDICFRTKPDWYVKDSNIVKYESWEEYVSSPINRILKYYEL